MAAPATPDVSSLNSSMDSLQMREAAAASSASASSASASSDGIQSFNNKTEDLHGYATAAGFNLKKNVVTKEKANGSTHDFKLFELGRCSLRPTKQDRFAAVGTDNPEAKENFLSLVDLDVMRQSARDDPVLCYTRVSEHLSDVKWLNDSTILAATGKGNLKLFKFNQQEKTVKHIGDMKDACTSYIREIAVQPETANNIAIGGFDQKLNLLDLNRPDNPYVQRLDMQSVIGSVKWAPFHGRSYVSTGLDEGKFYLFDARTKITEAAFYIDSRKEDLYTHERYNDFHVMLGYGDGEIKHIDMRIPNKVLQTVLDPYVEAIGGIEWCEDSQAFVVSGYTDHSVWHVKNGEAKVHAHSQHSEKVLHGSGFACNAVWYDRTTVLASDNAGEVRLFLQDFKA